MRFLPIPARIVLVWTGRLGIVPRVVAGTADGTCSPDLLVSWRLIGPSNREVARGTGLCAPDDLHDEIRRVRAGLRELAVQLTSSGAAQWYWRADLGGECIATSARQYTRRGECARRAAQFLETLPRADVDGITVAAAARREGRR